MRKGQAAMEFLMTYGWAILVVLVAIGALAYFGVLSPERLIPERCVMQAGIQCADAKVTPTTGTLVLRNSIGYTIDITNVSIGDICYNESTVTVLNGDQITLTIGNCTFTQGEKMNEDINIQYLNTQTSLSHTMTGSLVREVE